MWYEHGGVQTDELILRACNLNLFSFLSSVLHNLSSLIAQFLQLALVYFCQGLCINVHIVVVLYRRLVSLAVAHVGCDDGSFRNQIAFACWAPVIFHYHGCSLVVADSGASSCHYADSLAGAVIFCFLLMIR